MKGKKSHYSLDRPHHGWEGISNGGEIYGGSSKTSRSSLNNDGELYGESSTVYGKTFSNDDETYYTETTSSKREKECLKLIAMALRTSMEDTPDANDRAKEIMEYAKREYSDLFEEEQSSEKEMTEFQESTHRSK